MEEAFLPNPDTHRTEGLPSESTQYRLKGPLRLLPKADNGPQLSSHDLGLCCILIRQMFGHCNRHIQNSQLQGICHSEHRDEGG